MDPKVGNIDAIEPLQDRYEAPELVELGEAALLTLGNYGCKSDGANCTKNDPDGFDF
jgi:hypothetical protein